MATWTAGEVLSAMHAMTEASLQIIAEAATAPKLLVFSPDGDPLGTVIISESEALRSVCLPPMAV